MAYWYLGGGNLNVGDKIVDLLDRNGTLAAQAQARARAMSSVPSTAGPRGAFAQIDPDATVRAATMRTNAQEADYSAKMRAELARRQLAEDARQFDVGQANTNMRAREEAQRRAEAMAQDQARWQAEFGHKVETGAKEDARRQRAAEGEEAYRRLRGEIDMSELETKKLALQRKGEEDAKADAVAAHEAALRAKAWEASQANVEADNIMAQMRANEASAPQFAPALAAANAKAQAAREAYARLQAMDPRARKDAAPAEPVDDGNPRWDSVDTGNPRWSDGPAPQQAQPAAGPEIEMARGMQAEAKRKQDEQAAKNAQAEAERAAKADKEKRDAERQRQDDIHRDINSLSDNVRNAATLESAVGMVSQIASKYDGEDRARVKQALLSQNPALARFDQLAREPGALQQELGRMQDPDATGEYTRVNRHGVEVPISYTEWLKDQGIKRPDDYRKFIEGFLAKKRKRAD